MYGAARLEYMGIPWNEVNQPRDAARRVDGSKWNQPTSMSGVHGAPCV